jgi:hypothetical protein
MEIFASTRQLPKFIKTINKRYVMAEVFKFDLIAKSGCVDYGKLKVLIADFISHYDSLNHLYFFV